MHLQKELESKQIRIQEIQGPNQIEEIKKIYTIHLPMEMLIKYQNNDCRSCYTKKN